MKSSVIVATYNGEKYLLEQLSSILNQTAKVDEVIITDDGSTDSTIKLCESFIRKNSLAESWKIKKNVKNKGYAKNFLDAAMMASGEYIFFCDQDDVWIENRVDKMMQIVASYPQIDLLCTNMDVFYCSKDTKKWDKNTLSQMKNDEKVEFFSFENGGFHLKRSGCTMLVKRKYLHDVYPYWIEGWAHDDFLWKFSSVRKSCAVYHFISMRRRMHENNTSALTSRSRVWRVEQLNQTKNQLLKILEYSIEISASQTNIDIIKKNIRSIKLRLKVVQYRLFFLWPILYFHYKNCYPRKKGLYLDLYLCFFENYKGAN